MKTRILHSRFWDDGFVSSLPREAIMLFVYLLTCESINQCGIFELSDSKIMYHLKLTKIELDKAKGLLRPKVYFKNNWVRVFNVDKYNSFSGPTNEKARAKELELAPAYMVEVDTSMDTSIYTPGIPSIINNHNKKSIISKEGGVGETKITPEVAKLWDLWVSEIAPITTDIRGSEIALNKLVAKYGLEEVSRIIKVVAYANADKYSGKEMKCYSPAHLVSKWDSLYGYAKGKSTEIKNTGVVSV